MTRTVNFRPANRPAGVRLVLALLLAGILGPGPGARAETLRIAVRSAIDNADPHISFTPNRAVQLHVYEALLGQDEQMRPVPLLAESWRQPDPLTWEFTLRDGVRFQDGTPLTPEDVVFSLRRAQRQPGARSFATALRHVVAMEAAGPRRVVLRTDEPVPAQPGLLATIAIVSARAAGDAAPADWNGGPAAVGTGPYRWVRWTPGQDVVLARNPSYWGGPEPWDDVTIRFVPNDAARVASLLAGEVDVADAIPAGLWPRVRAAGLRVESVDSILTDYLYLDSVSPRIASATGVDGQPLPANPLRDARVREAMDRAINRDLLAGRVMEGGGAAAGQFMPAGLPGHVPGLGPTPHDPAASRRLLAEAGFPEGFGLSLTCATDRFVGDTAACLAVAQMLTAVGIRARPETLPVQVYIRRWFTMEPNGQSPFGATISATGSPAGSVLEWMNTILHSPMAEQGQGMGNPRFVGDPPLDAAIEAAARVADPADRAAAVEAAIRLAVAGRLVLPLFSLKASWGARTELSVRPRADGATLATGIRLRAPVPRR